MFKPLLILRAPDDPGGGGTDQLADPALPNAGVAPPPGQPKAAATVISGQRSEREANLEKELEAERQKLKAREAEVATVTDAFHRYKQTVETERKPKRPAKVCAFPWMRDAEE